MTDNNDNLTGRDPDLPVNPIFAIKQQDIKTNNTLSQPAGVTAENPIAKPDIAPQPSPVLETPIITMPPPPVKPKSKWFKILLVSLAGLVPIALIAYIFYWNFLPFGIDKTYYLIAGSLEDASGEVYFEPSKSLSGRMSGTSADGKIYTYREITGPVTVVFKPIAVLKNAKINISLQGDGVSFVNPNAEIDTEKTNWNFNWDFKKDMPSGFTGSAFIFDDCLQFDGNSSVELADSKNILEDGPFSLYVEWTPKDNRQQNQQIVGHYNWEIIQNNDSVVFQVGRMNDSDGPFYVIKKPVEADFFNKKHSLLAVYSPADESSVRSGSISLYVDGKFVSKTDIKSSVIWKDYGNKNLSLGKNTHNQNTNPYFTGCVHTVKSTDQNLFQNLYTLSLKSVGATTKFTIENSEALGVIRNLKIEAHE